MRLPKRALALLAVFVILAASGFVQAAEKGPARHSSSADFLGKVINFVLLFGTLGYILRKPLGKFLADRVALVRSGLKNAEETALQAQAKLRSIEDRTGTLESEVEAMETKAETDGRTEMDRIMQAARREAARLQEFSEQEIEAQVRAGVRQLKEYAADKALALALDRVRAKLTPDAQSRLVDASIEKLAEVHEKRDSRPALRPRTH